MQAQEWVQFYANKGDACKGTGRGLEFLQVSELIKTGADAVSLLHTVIYYLDGQSTISPLTIIREAEEIIERFRQAERTPEKPAKS